MQFLIALVLVVFTLPAFAQQNPAQTEIERMIGSIIISNLTLTVQNQQLQAQLKALQDQITASTKKPSAPADAQPR